MTNDQKVWEAVHLEMESLYGKDWKDRDHGNEASSLWYKWRHIDRWGLEDKITWAKHKIRHQKQASTKPKIPKILEQTKPKITPQKSDHNIGHLAPDDFHQAVDDAIKEEMGDLARDGNVTPFSAIKEIELSTTPGVGMVNEPKETVTIRSQEPLDAILDALGPTATKGQTMSTTKSTFNMAKGAFAEGGKLALAKKANHLACQALTAGLKKAGFPEELLTTEFVQQAATVLAPLAIHMAATHFSDRIPKAELVQIGCEKALTVASMETLEKVFEPIIEAMLPAIGEMAMAMTESQVAEKPASSPSLEEPQESTVFDDLLTETAKTKEPVMA